MSDLVPWITAAAAAIGAFLALYAALNARSARKAAEKASTGLVEIDGKVFRLDKRLDGPLEALMRSKDAEAKANEALADATGYKRGEQAQRDRASEAQS